MLDAVLARFGLGDRASEVRTALLMQRADEAAPTPRQLATAVLSALMTKTGVANEASLRAVMALGKLTDEEFGDINVSPIIILDGIIIRLPEPGGRGRHFELSTMLEVTHDETSPPLLGVIFNPSQILAKLP